VEELAFEDVQILDLLVLLQLAAVVLQLPAVVVLFLDFLQLVLLALPLDKDLLDQRTHMYNQLIYLDQLRSAHKIDALPEALVINQQLPVTDHL
jgi:hypothetical protein